MSECHRPSLTSKQKSNAKALGFSVPVEAEINSDSSGGRAGSEVCPRNVVFAEATKEGAPTRDRAAPLAGGGRHRGWLYPGGQARVTNRGRAGAGPGL